MLITSASSEVSYEAASSESELLASAEHEGGERLRKMTPCRLDTSEWAVKKGFCAYAISNNPVCWPFTSRFWTLLLVDENTHTFGFCLFDLILYVPSTIFQLNRDGSSWVEPVLS